LTTKNMISYLDTVEKGVINIYPHILIRCFLMKSLQKTEVLHYPTLKTVLAIEEVVKNSNLAASRNEILRRLENKVMRSSLNVVLDYLENRGMILETDKGFIWTFNSSKRLLKAEKGGKIC